MHRFRSLFSLEGPFLTALELSIRCEVPLLQRCVANCTSNWMSGYYPNVPSASQIACFSAVDVVGAKGIGITPKLQAQLDGMKSRYDELSAKLTDGNVGDDMMMQHYKECGELQEIVNLAREVDEKKKEISDLNTMMTSPSEDEEIKSIAKEEHEQLTQQVSKLEEQIVLSLLPKDDDDDRDVLLEVRAGVGGDEGSLFAFDILQMYRKYAQINRWKVEVLENIGEGGGCKYACLGLSGKGVYGSLKFENGVHRVQRVPTTESSGRIHTSTASVVVLPQVEEVDVQLNQDDLQIDVMRSSGAGGQHVNTTESAVRITHKPTGITVSMQDERSQHKNKAKALKVLCARIYELERQKQNAALSQARKTAIGTGDRSARIRTYNFPQGRVTDHRISLTEFGIEDMLNGLKMEAFVEALKLAEQSEKLEELYTGQ